MARAAAQDAAPRPPAPPRPPPRCAAACGESRSRLAAARSAAATPTAPPCQTAATPRPPCQNPGRCQVGAGSADQRVAADVGGDVDGRAVAAGHADRLPGARPASSSRRRPTEKQQPVVAVASGDQRVRQLVRARRVGLDALQLPAVVPRCRPDDLPPARRPRRRASRRPVPGRAELGQDRERVEVALDQARERRALLRDGREHGEAQGGRPILAEGRRRAVVSPARTRQRPPPHRPDRPAARRRMRPGRGVPLRLPPGARHARRQPQVNAARVTAASPRLARVTGYRDGHSARWRTIGTTW